MQLLELQVIDKIPETTEAITFLLRDTSGAPPRYQPGQFLTFLVPYLGQELRRSYSIAALQQDHYAVTIKRQENGTLSRHLPDHLETGTIINSLPPAGRFTIQTSPTSKRTFLFVAAGSGIVPVHALIQQVLQEEPASRVILLYQNHDEESIIYKGPLQELENRYPAQFSCLHLLSHPQSVTHTPRRLNNWLLEQLVLDMHLDPASTLVYTCGPHAFMRMVQFTLKVMGFTEEHIRKEIFTVGFIPAPAFVIDKKPRTVHINTPYQQYTLKVSYPTTILQAALDQGIHLPYSCKAGRCSSCVARCTSGQVKMSYNEVLTEKDIASGLTLTCVGYAATDVSLDFSS